MNKKQLEGLKDIFEKEIRDLGYELVDIEFLNEVGMRFLRFYIYSKEGIKSSDTEIVSRYLNTRLDELDPIKEQYYLEVSSPDLNRPLKTDRDLERNINEDVVLTFYKKLDGKKSISGKLEKFDGDYIYLNINDEIKEYKRDLISNIKPVI